MIGQATGHRWSQQHLTAYALDLSGTSAQLVMGPTQIVGTAKPATCRFPEPLGAWPHADIYVSSWRVVGVSSHSNVQ
jgi:hypothetical protein